MKNILGNTEDLELFNKEGKKLYNFITYSNGVTQETTYDTNGNQLSLKESTGYSHEATYDVYGNELSFKNSNGYSHEATYDSEGNQLTYVNSNGFVENTETTICN